MYPDKYKNKYYKQPFDYEGFMNNKKEVYYPLEDNQKKYYHSRTHISNNKHGREEIHFEMSIPFFERLLSMITQLTFSVPKTRTERWEHKGRLWQNMDTKHFANEDKVIEISDFKQELEHLNKK